MNRWKVCAAVVLAGSLHAAAQNPERVLRDALVKKQMYLRGFSAEEHVRGHWDGSAIVMDEPAFRALAVFTAGSVDVKGDKVVIKGIRQGLLRDSETHVVLSPVRDRVSIEVDLRGADKDAVLTGLEKNLFYENLRETMGVLPERYRKTFPPRLDKEQRSGPKGQKPCDCADATCKDFGIPVNGLTYPKVLSSVEPEFPEEVRVRQGFSANVQVGLDVDIAGHPSDVWIVRPAGMGMDKSAAEAVKQYKFVPAACHGKPFPFDLFIDINFQKF